MPPSLRREAGSIQAILPLRLMDLNGFQKYLVDISGALLHSPAEALVMFWNQRTAKALNQIVPVYSLLTLHSHPSLCFMEELQVLKRIKRCLERCWRKARDDWLLLIAAIETFLVAVKVAKHFPALMASSEHCPMALFKITQFLLGQGGSDIHLKGHTEEFVQHFTDKVAQIHSQIEPMHCAGCLGSSYLGTVSVLLDVMKWTGSSVQLPVN